MVNSNNMDMAKLMSLLSKMDNKQLEQGLSKLNSFLTPEEKEKIMKGLQKNN